MKKTTKSRIGLLVMSLASLAPATTAAAVDAGGQPDLQKIVYARSAGDSDVPRETEIFVMDEDGTNVVRLTENAKEDAFPAFSPDKARIAFSRRIRGQFDLFVANADGTDVDRVTRTGKGDEVLPTWSPAGDSLAVTVTTETRNGWQSDIYRVTLESGDFARLTHTPRAKEFAPDWSPDGTEIAFTKMNQARENYGIAAVRPDGSGLRWVVINPLSKNGYTDVNPSWSPDSDWIAFSRDHGEDPFVDVFKVRRDGSEVLPVTELSELAENPVWGDDGRILFMHNEGIAVVPADGGEVAHLTPTQTGIPYWWPDW